MTANEQQTAKDQAVAQGKLEQKFNDIGDDNKRLKTSIEQKDATLAKIALDQYALNFTPQVTPYIQDKPEEIFFQNNGKTNVTLSSMSCQQIAVTPTDNGTPAVLAPGTSVSILLNDIAKQVILNDAATNADVERKVEFPCQITIATLDNKMYILKFTWTFAVKASVISRSFTITQQITAKP